MTDRRTSHAVLVALGSSGDVHPFLGLGRELRRRGHRVTLVAAGWFRQVAEGAGLEFVDPLPDLDFVASIRDERIWDPLRGTPVILERFVRPLLEPVYRLIERTSAADAAAGHFAKGLSIDEVAALMGRATSTVAGYLQQWIEEARPMSVEA